MRNVICIPAYKPDEKLLTLVESLEETGFIHIVLADDGSGQEYTPVFVRAEELGCEIVHHEHNLGKGAALRSGIQKAILQFGRDINVITADADGQHLPQDIIKISDTLDAYPGHLVLGVRDFDKEDVPPPQQHGEQDHFRFFQALYGSGLHRYPDRPSRHSFFPDPAGAEHKGRQVRLRDEFSHCRCEKSASDHGTDRDSILERK